MRCERRRRGTMRSLHPKYVIGIRRVPRLRRSGSSWGSMLTPCYTFDEYAVIHSEGGGWEVAHQQPLSHSSQKKA
jgi:hypothetical protein